MLKVLYLQQTNGIPSHYQHKQQKQKLNQKLKKTKLKKKATQGKKGIMFGITDKDRTNQQQNVHQTKDQQNQAKTTRKQTQNRKKPT
jgi:hypothetical protein